MRVLGRIRPAAVGLFMAFGVACKDSGAPAVTPSVLFRVSGDSQATVTGGTLSQPLTVRVTGSNGQPFPGASVTWTVTAGTATPGSPTAVSDQQGFASTTLTLGATPGAIGIQAAVTAVTPVTFAATACEHPVLPLNDTLPGALANTDCKFGGFYTDFYELSVAGPQGVELTLKAGTFDTWLELYQRAGGFLAYDDDIDSTNTNSQLTAILPTGDYLVAPSSYNPLVTGAYTMAALTRPAALSGCGLIWVTRGVTISDSVTAGDCVDSSGGTYYADVVALYLVAGTTLTVSHRSTAFDAALFLRNAAGTSVMSNNDSADAGTTTNAYFVYPVVATGSYLLFAGTNTQSSTGAYSLIISASSNPPTSRARGEEGPQILRMAPVRTPKGLSWRTRFRTAP